MRTMEWGRTGQWRLTVNWRVALLAVVLLTLCDALMAQETSLTVVELNVENLFDTAHDSLKNDREWLPGADRHWSRRKYWDKLNRIGQAILSCGVLRVPLARQSEVRAPLACQSKNDNGNGNVDEDQGWVLPDLVGLCEVENDSCLFDLCRRSLLRRAEYEYVMTDSPDSRGIDVALLYSPFAFRLLNHRSVQVTPLPDMRPTRDILYAAGELMTGDTLHVFVLHAPSRIGGERLTEPHRLQAMRFLCAVIDSVRCESPLARLLVMGDFNDNGDGEAFQLLLSHGLMDVSLQAAGSHGARGTYKYKGRWDRLDHILVSENWVPHIADCRIHDAPFLLEDDGKYGGVQPFRTYVGYRYRGGFSDHLPLVLTIRP